MCKLIAFYLPQFYSFPENDKWWGKGFTEWTNVGKAKKLFPNHYQPRVPADLGYYNLRNANVREEQANLAKYAGIDAFCYWHYWFGGGKQLLNEVLEEVVALGKPDFPFCLGWANHSWFKKNWNKDVSRFNNEVLIEQTYPGIEDIDNHFYKMLPMFKDKRYYKVHDKLLFFIYDPHGIPQLTEFVNRWQVLAQDNGLPPFYFIGNVTRSIEQEKGNALDAYALDLKNKAFNIEKNTVLRKGLSYLFPFPINVIRYSKAIDKMVDDILFRKSKIYPIIYPNWDHSPRAGNSASIMHGSTPQLWGKLLEKVISLIRDKDEGDQIIFIKSWNEWGEGNYLEPDLKYGRGYLDVMNKMLRKENVYNERGKW